MPTQPAPQSNVTQAVTFFRVRDMQRSLSFYCEGLGFEMTHRWTPDGNIRWCWLNLGQASLMLQDYWSGEANAACPPPDKHGVGVSVCFMCNDALAIYRETKARGLITTQKPFVGNRLWVVSFQDPDGYRIDFESPTDVPEETVYSD